MSALLLAVSLSMDALGIGISYGLRGIKTSDAAKLVIALISVIFTAAAVFFGNLLLFVIPAGAAKLIGALMLFAFGAYIVCSGLLKKPEQFDSDCSKHIDRAEALYLGVALSIDSFGAGILFAVTGITSYFVPFLVGICQLLFLCSGMGLGKKITSFKRIPQNLFAVFSGILLIIIALLRLVL